MTIEVKFDFRCKACGKFKTKDCAYPSKAKTKWSCKEHTAFRGYEETLVSVGSIIADLKEGVT